MKRIIRLGLSVLFFGCMTAQAIKIPSMPGMPGKSDESSESAKATESAADSQDVLVSQFKGTLGSILLAQKYLSIAFDQSDQAAALDTEISSLEGDCGTDCLKRAVKLSGNATESISEKIDAKTEIGAEGKTNYALALPPYIKGTLSAKDLASAAGTWSKQATGEIKGAGMMGATKLKKKLETGMYVAQQTPKLIKSWATATKQIFTYAKSSDIDLGKIEGANEFNFGD